jgi:alkanesulfonate monooxygenase SsuD/methylene tetrahydromethanopterin reductase-like flavin-dependent oxidoreductase (luciferase family)
MRVSTLIRISPAAKQDGANPDSGLMDRLTDFARQVEARGFPGIWIGDSLGRGRPTLDSLQVLTALAAVTSKVELGISVLQLPLRNPIELTHRVQSLQAMSNKRLILGVGSGSTRDDFELLGYDYDHRFRTFKNDLEIMDRVWNGEPVNGGTLATWPGCKGGPPILIGAWRSPRWITYAAKEAEGWRPVGSAAGTTSNTAWRSIARPAAPMPFSPIARSTSPNVLNRLNWRSWPRSISSARRRRRAGASNASSNWASRRS